ncbi:hypothetical protein ACFWJW_13960 [Streptomyces sp. NPDC127097]|uniref:hypothetical protein n=1 Tax=Streptomyces sp. NPDC127097 TaxID=3347136 RepID=UPI0036671E4C
MGGLVKGFVEPIAKRWSAAMGGPLLLFWLAGTLIVLWRRGGGTHPCRVPEPWAGVSCGIAAQQPVGPIVLSAAALALVVVSAWAASASAPFVLEVLAGRWGTSRPALAHTRRRIVRHRAWRAALAGHSVPPSGLTGDALDAWQVQSGWRGARRRAATARYPRPRDPEPLLPTALGNALISVPAEIRRKYGLELSVCWDPFVKALDAPDREDLTAAATRVFARVQALMCAVATTLWAVLLPGWWPRLLWIAVCGLFVWAAHRALRAGVDAYCLHVGDIFAVRRVRLYRALGIAPPASSAQEVPSGEILSATLSLSLSTLPNGPTSIPYDWSAA